MPIRIFIDQGHNLGFVNAGAQANGLIESEINYNVGIYLAELLNADPNFEVRTSRTDPEEVLGDTTASSLAIRVGMANEWPADYFISIHGNANENPAINGAEVYVFAPYTEPFYLAEYVLDAIVETVGIRNNGVRLNPSLYVLRRTAMPAILVELGYLTNLSDAQLLKDNQRLFAYGIYRGLLNYFGLQPTA